MGFSYSTFALIMFAGLLLSAPIMLSGIQPGYDETMKSYDGMADGELDRSHTSLVLDRAWYNGSSGNWERIILNNGETVINVSRISALLEGEHAIQLSLLDNNYERIENLFPGEYGLMIIRDPGLGVAPGFRIYMVPESGPGMIIN